MRRGPRRARSRPGPAVTPGAARGRRPAPRSRSRRWSFRSRVVACSAVVALAGASRVDALRGPSVALRSSVHVPAVLSRGVPAAHDRRRRRAGGRVRLRQAAPPALDVEPREATARSTASVSPRRRGRHALAGGRDPLRPARSASPLGPPARRDGRDPRLSRPARRPPARARRRARRFRDQGATGARPARPRHRVRADPRLRARRRHPPGQLARHRAARAADEQPVPARAGPRRAAARSTPAACPPRRSAPRHRPSSTRASTRRPRWRFVADELGDRCGAVAFDEESAPRSRRAAPGGQAVVRALFDLEPRPLDSDYELAFRRVEGAKRALVRRASATCSRRPRRARWSTRCRCSPAATPSSSPARRTRRSRRSPRRVPEPRATRRAAPPSPPTCWRPARRAAARSARPARRSSRRRRTALPAALVAAYLRAKARAVL